MTKKQDSPQDLAAKKAIVIRRVFERICQRDHEGWLAKAAAAHLDYLVPFAWSKKVRNPVDIFRNIRDVMRYAGAAFEVDTADLLAHKDYPAFKEGLEKKGFRVEMVYVGLSSPARRHFPHIGIKLRAAA